MATKKPVAIYNGILKQIQSGDQTLGESSATISKSIATRAQSLARLGGSESYGKRGESLAKRAESQGILDNSLADYANSVARRAESQALLDNSIADRSNSLGRRAESLARLGGTSGSGINEIEVKASDMFLDTTDTGSDKGTLFGIMDSVNFTPGIQGTAWLNFEFPANWVASKDINFKLLYSLNGNDPAKTCTINSSWWVVDEGATPVVGSPTGTGVDNITSASGNISKLVSLALTNGKVALASLSANTRKIAVKLTRPSTDTYTGTLQLQAVIFYQP
jgi:hypothetical protein